jgi:hypothetical protein
LAEQPLPLVLQNISEEADTRQVTLPNETTNGTGSEIEQKRFAQLFIPCRPSEAILSELPATHTLSHSITEHVADSTASLTWSEVVRQSKTSKFDCEKISENRITVNRQKSARNRKF